MSSPSNSSAQPYLWMLAGSSWFAAMILFIKACEGLCTWQTITLFRSGAATLFALALALASKVPLVLPGPPTLWLRSLSGSFSMVTTFYALSGLAGSDVLVLTNSFPVWVALFSWPAFGEVPKLGTVLAILCAVSGVAVMQQADLSRFTIYHGSAICASIFTAIAMMGLNRLKGLPSLAIVVHFSAVSVLFCGSTFLLFPLSTVAPLTPNDGLTWGKLVMVGATATIGQLFLTKAFRGGKATSVSVVGLSQVVMVMLWEAAVDGRRFDGFQLGGTILVLGPIAYLMGRERPKAAEPSEPEVAIE